MLGLTISPIGDHDATIQESQAELGDSPEHAVMEVVHKMAEGIFGPRASSFSQVPAIPS